MGSRVLISLLPVFVIAMTANSAENGTETNEIKPWFWQNEFDGVHSFSCPSGQSVRRIESEHNNGREDRRWLWSCQEDGALSSSTDSRWTEYVNKMDGILYYNCPIGYIITGTYSYHDNYREDRRFKYKCSKVDSMCSLTNCHHTSNLNVFDGRMDFSVPDQYELKGLWSEHHNRHEDRIWMARICKIYCGAPSYSVYHVDWDTSGISFGMKPQGLSTQRIDNPTDATVKTTVEFNEKRTVSETTSWGTSFESSVSFSAGVNIEIFSMSTQVTLSCGTTQGRENTVITEKSFRKSFEVSVPPHTSVEVQLVVKKKDNAVIPFTATLIKVANGRTTTVTKTGTWKGVLYSDDTVKVIPMGKVICKTEL